MFAPEIADGTIKVVLQDWKLPRIDLRAAFPARPVATAKARTFIQFAQEVMRLPGGAATRFVLVTAGYKLRRWKDICCICSQPLVAQGRPLAAGPARVRYTGPRARHAVDAIGACCGATLRSGSG
jgi:hypothetical protein